MAQNTILAAGATTATSTDVTILAGESVVVGIFRDAGEMPRDVSLTLMQDTPGADLSIFVFDEANPSTVIAGPGTFRVVRQSNSQGFNIGVFSET